MLAIIKRNKTLTALLIFFVIIYSLSKFVHFNQYKVLIKEQFATAQLDITINGDVEFEFFPLPHLEFNDVIISFEDELLVSADKILKGGINLFNKKVKNLTLADGMVNYKVFNQYIKQSNNTQNIALLHSLKLKNIEIMLEHGGKLNEVNGDLNYNGQKFNASFEVVYKKEPLKIDVLINKIQSDFSSDNVMLNVESQDFTVKFKGRGTEIFAKNNFEGKLDTEFQNFQFMNRVFNLNFDELAYIKNENLNFSADFSYIDTIKLDNIIIDSDNISNFKSSVNITPNLKNSIVVQVENINLDGLFSGEANDLIQKSFLTFLSSFNRKLPTTGLEFTGDIKNIILNGQNITDFKIKADLVNDIMTVSKFEALMPGQTAAKINGVVSHNDIRPIFEGELNFASNKFSDFMNWITNSTDKYARLGDDLLIKSDVIIIPHRLILSDIKGILDKKVFQGKYYLKDNSTRGPTLNLSLKINQLDLDKFGFSNKLEQKIVDLAIAENDKSGEYYSKITDDFLALRKLTGVYDIDIEVSKLLINKHQLNDFRFDARINSGLFDIRSLMINDYASDFNLFARITIPRIRPQVNFGIQGNMLDKGTIDAMLPRYSDFMQKAKVKAKLMANQLKERDQDAEKFSVFPDLNLLGLSHLDSSIVVDLNKLKWGDVILDEFKINADMKNSVLHLHELTAKQGRGTIKLNGNLVLITVIPSASLNFSLSNISPELPLYIVTNTRGLMDGYFSIVGSIVTSGVTFKEWGQKLAGQAQFAGKKINYNGFDIAKIVEIPDIGISYEAKLERLDYYQKYGESTFDDIKGKIIVESGIAKISDSTFTTKRSNGIFVGNYDISSRQIVAKSRFNFFARSSNIPISIDINTSGPFASRDTQFDNTKIVEFITARANSSRNTTGRDSLLNSRLR